MSPQPAPPQLGRQRRRDRCPQCGALAVARSPYCSVLNLEEQSLPTSLPCYFRCRACNYRYRNLAHFEEEAYVLAPGSERVSLETWNERQLHIRIPPLDMPATQESAFFASWDFVEDFFDGQPHPDFAPLCALIEAMRQADYDWTLRAGQSLTTLVLSRAQEHGAFDNYLALDMVPPASVRLQSRLDDEDRSIRLPCDLRPGLLDYLDRLQACPVEGAEDELDLPE